MMEAHREAQFSSLEVMKTSIFLSSMNNEANTGLNIFLSLITAKLFKNPHRNVTIDNKTFLEILWL